MYYFTAMRCEIAQGLRNTHENVQACCLNRLLALYRSNLGFNLFVFFCDRNFFWNNPVKRIDEKPTFKKCLIFVNLNF